MVEKTYQLILTSFVFKLCKKLVWIFCSLPVFLLPFSSHAETLRLISDEETEQFLADILKPLYQSAGIAFSRNNVFLVDDNSLNAFVGDGNIMFVHTGTLMNADNANQIVGVLAHETGHIQGGHIIRQKIKMQSLQQASLASMVAAGILGAATGRADVGMAVLLGTSSSALHNMSAYQIQEERSADEAAVQLLNKTKQSPAGIRDFMKKIQQQNIMEGIEENTYLRTHPVTSERITFLSQAAEKSPYPLLNSELENRFELIKAKLQAFLQPPEKILKQFPITDTSVPAYYARSIAYFRLLNINLALKNIDILLQNYPKNPFFHELKAQIFMETGNLSKAVEEYQIAYDLLPNSALFQINLAQAMIENSPNANDIQKIINLLNQSLILRQDSFAWLLLSRAYGLKNDIANANYAAAEFSFSNGDLDTAERQTDNALKANPSNSLKLKLDDLQKRIFDLQKQKRKQIQYL